MRIHKYFHWAYHTFGWKHAYNLGTGLFIWLFLLLTRPFGVYVNDLSHFVALALLLLPVGVSFILISYLTDFGFRRLLKVDLSSSPRMDGISWILKLVLFVHVVFLMRLTRCAWECFDGLEYLEQWFAFSFMILLTYLPLALYGRSNFFRSLVGKEQVGQGNLILRGEGKEKIVVNPNDLILLKADDNYVDVFVSNSEAPTKKTIRITLKAVENQLTAHPQFQRVHRSFVVNLKYTAKRNFNTLEVKDGKWSMDVPLSPSFRDSVQSLLS
ncbi:MAG: LytTR family DNA-binding domain-containing protein [Cyclobacteriaceae bacterium]